MEDLEAYGSEVGHGFQAVIAEVHSSLKNGFSVSETDGPSLGTARIPDVGNVKFALPSLEEIKEVEQELERLASEHERPKGRSCVIS